MASPHAVEMGRLEFRIENTLKAEIEEAATLVGVTVTAFATQALLERARQVKKEHSLTVLDREETEALMEMLRNPPEPSDGLIKLMNPGISR